MANDELEKRQTDIPSAKGPLPTDPVKPPAELSEEAQQILHFLQEIRDAVELMEFAIKNGRTLDDGTLEKIKRAEGYLQNTKTWPSDSDRADFEKAYRDLAIFMKPVTIETLRATTDGHKGSSRTWITRFSKSSDAKIFSKKLWLWVIFCSLIIVGLETSSQVWGADEEAAGSFCGYVLLFLKPLHPFFYGLFGSLAFLLRSAHSYIADNTFDLKRIPEYYNRMLLGFISGGIVLLFIDPAKFSIGQGAISFIVGYNTDYLFDMIERLANGIFPKVSLTVTPKDAGAARPGIAKVQVATAAKELEPGGRGNATVTLTGPAPAEGVIVALTADRIIALQQQTVTIAAGATSAQFAFSVSFDGFEGQASITATANGSSASDSVLVRRALELSEVKGIKGVNEIILDIFLTREAGTDDVKVALSADQPWCDVPPLVPIPKGQSQARVKAPLRQGATGSVKITASTGKRQSSTSVQV